MGMHPYVYTGVGISVKDAFVDEKQKEDFLENFRGNENITNDIAFIWDADGADYLMIVMSLDEGAAHSGKIADIKEFDFDELEKIRHKFLQQYNELNLKEITRNQIKLITGAFVR